MFIIIKGPKGCEHNQCSFHELKSVINVSEQNHSFEKNFLTTSNIWLEVEYEIQALVHNPVFSHTLMATVQISSAEGVR